MTKAELIRNYIEASKNLKKSKEAFNGAEASLNYLRENLHVKWVEASDIEVQLQAMDPGWSKWEELKGHV